MRYGNLEIVKELPSKVYASGRKQKIVLCRCLCGNKEQRVIQLSHLTSGHTKSCGCLQKEKWNKTITKHGLQKHPMYSVLRNMKERCYNTNNRQYPDYGGRGIKICKEWNGANGIVYFVSWNDSLPKKEQYAKGLQIDRINNNKGYHPENCRWVTNKINSSNRRDTIVIQYKGQKYSFTQFYEKYSNGNISYNSAKARIKSGWFCIHAVTCKPNSRRPKRFVFR